MQLEQKTNALEHTASCPEDALPAARAHHQSRQLSEAAATVMPAAASSCTGARPRQAGVRGTAASIGTLCGAAEPAPDRSRAVRLFP